MRKKVSLTIDKSILEKSHALGINVSKACENYLIEIIHALENLKTQNTPFLGKASFGKEGLVRLPGFEPGSSTWQADVLNHSSEILTESSVNPVARLQPHVEAMIANTLIKLQVNAKAQSTIKANEYILKHLSKHVNLLKPEEECQAIKKGYNS